MSQSLQTKEGRLGAQSSMPIVRLDISERNVAALPQFLDRTQLPSGASFVLVLHADARNAVDLRARIDGLARAPVIHVEQTTHLERDRVYVVSASKPFTLAGDTIELAERDEAAARLRRSEQRYRAIMDSVRDYAIMTTDLGGVIDGWNTGAEQLFGYSRAEILGHPVDILFTPEDRAAGAPQAEMATAREKGRADDERFHLRKDGTRFYCSGVLSPMIDGEIYGFVKIARDLTRQQAEATEHERQFVRVQADRVELQHVNQLKDSFLATLSHELRNPLNLILMESEILRRSPEVEAQASLKRATDVICQTVKVQARLINDLLDVSRLNTGKLALERQPLALSAVVAESITALQNDIEQKQIGLDLALSGDPLVINGDPIRVRQIAWNLVSNAIKFTPSGGRIAVRVERDGDQARLDVEDTGQGITGDYMPHVFELFSQKDAGAARRYSGLGIGLALVRQLVDLHGGHVEAYSAGENKGARFSVWLPLDHASEVAPYSLAADAMPGSAVPLSDLRNADDRKAARRLDGLRVLVVDDDVASAEALHELLHDEGARVRAANSARDALALAERRDFDVVISDVAMPGMDGHAFLRKLREDPRYANVPAIACTGYGGDADVSRAEAAGYVAHLVKPLDIAGVIAAIRTAIAGGKGR
jgi:two-component system CheB/CheR fusion protein